MTVWAVIPVQPLDEGKSRLAAVLNPAERLTLNSKFFHHVLKTALAVFPPDRVLVVSRSADVLAAADRVRTLAETKGGDLNGALTTAAQAAARGGAEAVLSISCDLPLLAPSDLQAMCDAGISAIAPDHAGVGTNALLCPVNKITYAYGDGSFARHTAHLEAHGLHVTTVRREGLAFDVDTPDDLKRLRALKPEF